MRPSSALVKAAEGVPPDATVTFDVYTWEDDGETSGDALSSAGLADTLAPALAARPERVVVAIGGAGPAHRVSSVRHLTFTPGPDDSLVEDDSVHGLHPLMVERLHLWRLANFAVERLPAAEDIYLVRAVAHANPKDQRLLAMGEVRDLTPVRDDDGRVVALPAARAGAARGARGDAPGAGPAAAGTSVPVEPGAALRVAARSTSPSTRSSGSPATWPRQPKAWASRRSGCTASVRTR